MKPSTGHSIHDHQVFFVHPNGLASMDQEPRSTKSPLKIKGVLGEGFPDSADPDSLAGDIWGTPKSEPTRREWHHTTACSILNSGSFQNSWKPKKFSGTISKTYPKCMNLISRKHPNISCPNVWGGPTMLRTFMKSQYWPWRSPTWDLMILMGDPPWELPGPIFGDILAGRAPIFGPNCEASLGVIWNLYEFIRLQKGKKT